MLNNKRYDDFVYLDKHEVTVEGDKNTFYPVLIHTKNLRYLTTISVWRTLGEKPSAVWPGESHSGYNEAGGGVSCQYVYQYCDNV